jgi:DNA-binding MarR family transcriptional regulator
MNQRRAEFPLNKPGGPDWQPPDEGTIVEFGRPPIPERHVIYARRLKAARLARSNFFHSDLFAEPAWDMMLALYIAEGEGFRLKVSDLCYEGSVPTTTALRWLDRLLELQMARKRRSPTDGRVHFVEIHPDTTRKMNAYFELTLKRHASPI